MNDRIGLMIVGSLFHINASLNQSSDMSHSIWTVAGIIMFVFAVLMNDR